MNALAHASSDALRFESAIRRFDEENALDPHREQVMGEEQPRELLYARRLSDWVLRLCPSASEELRLAARCQHLCRWSIPRNTYEMTRAGYLRWRNDLKQFHARKAAEILREVGYSEETIRLVQELNLKKNFPKDPQSQILEDALCLVFLECQLEDFIFGKEDAKIVEIIQKTWKKMTPAGHAQALALPLSAKAGELVKRALAPSGPEISSRV